MLKIQEINRQQLTPVEKESILQHAIDLHLIGSDDVEDPGFDIVEQGSERVKHILRLIVDHQNVGVMYVHEGKVDRHFEMTILVHHEFRGRHLTAEAVDALEKFMLNRTDRPVYLCAAVHDHNPFRRELTSFLLRHDYAYSPTVQMFVKVLN